MASNVASRFSPAVRNCLRRAAHIFVANAETERGESRARFRQRHIEADGHVSFGGKSPRLFAPCPGQESGRPAPPVCGGQHGGAQRRGAGVAGAGQGEKSRREFPLPAGGERAGNPAPEAAGRPAGFRAARFSSPRTCTARITNANWGPRTFICFRVCGTAPR